LCDRRGGVLVGSCCADARGQARRAPQLQISPPTSTSTAIAEGAPALPAHDRGRASARCGVQKFFTRTTTTSGASTSCARSCCYRRTPRWRFAVLPARTGSLPHLPSYTSTADAQDRVVNVFHFGLRRRRVIVPRLVGCRRRTPRCSPRIGRQHRIFMRSTEQTGSGGLDRLSQGRWQRRSCPARRRLVEERSAAGPTRHIG